MYDREKLMEKAEFRALDEKGKPFPPSNSVYEKISDHMHTQGSSITPKHTYSYTILNENRSGMKDYVLRTFNINKAGELNQSAVDDSSFNLSNTSTTENVTLSLVISNDVWKDIKPITKTYCNRKYVLLQSGKWTHVFAAKIWEQKKIPCAFTFKYAKVFKSSDAKYYARFTAVCTECKAKLSGHLLHKPKKHADVIFECRLKNYQSTFWHKKKRQLKGHLRQKIASHLLDGKQDASTWRTNKAKCLMDNGDPIPPTLYNATVLRKAKQQEMDRRLELKHCDPILNLNVAKYESFAGIIGNIGLDPFFCMYWTEEQKIFYKTVMNRNHSSFLTIDATGSFAKKLKLVNKEKSPHIYLYQCVLVTETTSTPVFQMVSTKQDASMIVYFLIAILADGAPLPRMVVTDFSKALLMAVSKAFANCADTCSYVQTLYDIVILEKQEKLPSCYIRLDVNHFIGMISKWDCLRGKVAKVRQFYLRSIGHIYKMSEIQNIKSLLISIMVVTLSEDIGSDENFDLLLSEYHLRSVNDVIKGSSIEDATYEEEINEETLLENFNENPNGWMEWAKSIYESAEAIAAKSVSGSVVNAFYNPQLALKLKNLIFYLPLWTGIARSHFRCDKLVATFSAVEASFADLKHRLFKGELPIGIDKFIVKHIDFLQGKTLLALANESTACKEQDTMNSKENMWDVVENWRGLTAERKSNVDEIDPKLTKNKN